MQFAKCLEAFTVDVIGTCYFGDSAALSDDLLSDMRTVWAGLYSIPRRLPWPLSRTPLARAPLLNFGRASDARDRLAAGMRDAISKRRSKLAAASVAGSINGGPRRHAVVDSLLAMQVEQQRKGGVAEGEMVLDDAFVIDNVSP